MNSHPAHDIASAEAEAIAFGQRAHALAGADLPLSERLRRACLLLGLVPYARDPELALLFVWSFLGPVVRQAAPR